MRANKKLTHLLTLSALTFLVAGCLPTEQPAHVNVRPDPIPQSNAAKRFDESAHKGTTAVESAIRLSEKYTELSQEMTLVKQKNQELTSENRRFGDRLAVLEPELEQTKKELTQANDLLIEMRIELNNWKTDILGFRDEMRNAETEQLRALLKVLEILGGEAKTASDQNQDKNPDVSSANQPTEPTLREIPTPGEPNE